MITKNLYALRSIMKQHQIDIYIIPTADFHQSEYVGDHFNARQFLSGFTGSAGTLIVSHFEALLWVDGRYFIQAEKEVKDTKITLMKIGLPNVPTIHEYITYFKDKKIGFDGRVLAASEVLSFGSDTIVYDVDLVNEIWHNRPVLSCHPGFLYDTTYCGESRIDKLTRIRQEMGECSHHVVTALDDIGWIFNIRGKDIACNPTILAYAIINLEDAYLYVQENTLSKDAIDILEKDAIYVREYSTIYNDVGLLTGKVLLDLRVTNYAIYKNITCPIVNQPNPSQYFKSIKNEIEIKNTIHAHIKDGVAMTKFMFWLKTNVGKIDMDELTISDTLTSFRKQQDLFYDVSFHTICGYKENAALMHYQATKESYRKIKPEGLLLIDSGGQYLDGTTDITRTFALGPIRNEERKDFTITLKAMQRLQRAKFLYGASGTTLDILARGIVYDYGLDYRCGTGHGVGHFLNVHEGPNGFRPSNRPGMVPLSVQEAGMITTNEPGIYKEGSHGIRLENELLCVKDEVNEYGQFMKFEVITFCPIDLDAIDFTMLNTDEIKQLNEYHSLVFNKVSPYLTIQEKTWLEEFIKVGN